jgi:hypothetical protein
MRAKRSVYISLGETVLSVHQSPVGVLIIKTNNHWLLPHNYIVLTCACTPVTFCALPHAFLLAFPFVVVLPGLGCVHFLSCVLPVPVSVPSISVLIFWLAYLVVD